MRRAGDEEPVCRAAAEHFGQIDVWLPFGGVAPGAYWLRVTVHNRLTSRTQEEAIQVAAAR